MIKFQSLQKKILGHFKRMKTRNQCSIPNSVIFDMLLDLLSNIDQQSFKTYHGILTQLFDTDQSPKI